MANCNNNTNPCNKKESTDEVAYVGPNLTCTGVNTCDTLTQAIQKINEFICSEAMVQQIIFNITNNIEIYNQFVEIVNVSVSCETIWGCETTTTTTTDAGKCFIYELENTGEETLPWTAKLCEDGTNVGGIILVGQTITTPCVDQSTLVLVDGVGIKTFEEC